MKFEFRFPDIGEGIHEGVITKWLINEGDSIKEGESVAEVETDKVTTEIPSPKTGKVLELKAKKGETINVGQVFITINTDGEATDENSLVEQDKNDVEEETKEIGEEETAGVVGEVVASSEVIASSTEGAEIKSVVRTTEKILATPVARKLAKDLGVEIHKVSGTGPNGRIMKEDIYKTSEETPQASESAKPVSLAKKPLTISDERIERIPLTKIRKTIAEKMTQSRFTIPHTTAMDEIDVSSLYEFRKKYKDVLREEDVNLTYLPFIIKAVIVALKKLPEFNASLDEEKSELVLKHFYHIGIATDTDRGLMVPVVRDADKMSIVEMARAIADVSSRAKNNTIELSELRGSSFSVTNYGSIGGYFGIPIINFPESGVLGLGRVVKKPIVKDDEIIIAHVLPVSLSYDHRIIDGASGAKFLNLLKELLQDSDMLLLKA